MAVKSLASICLIFIADNIDVNTAGLLHPLLKDMPTKLVISLLKNRKISAIMHLYEIKLISKFKSYEKSKLIEYSKNIYFHNVQDMEYSWWHGRWMSRGSVYNGNCITCGCLSKNKVLTKWGTIINLCTDTECVKKIIEYYDGEPTIIND